MTHLVLSYMINHSIKKINIILLIYHLYDMIEIINHVNYCVSKPDIIGFSARLVIEFGGRGIRVKLILLMLL